MPTWLHDIFLGYGDPAAAHWRNLPDPLPSVDFKDTFLDAEHLEASFPGYQARCGPTPHPLPAYAPPASICATPQPGQDAMRNPSNLPLFAGPNPLLL